MEYVMDDEREENRVKNRTHRIDGAKHKGGTMFPHGNKPADGGCDVHRSHAEIESLKSSDGDLDEGIPFRVGMGDMDNAIEDGKNGY